MLKPRKHLLELVPYQMADLSGPPGKELIQLAQNESAVPPSLAALEAYREASREIRLYPESDLPKLHKALAEVHGLNSEQIHCGSGSMELISLLTRIYLGPGDSAVTSKYSYLFFRTCSHIAEASVRLAPEADLTVDVDALLKAVRDDTRIVFVVNPGNPTGSLIPKTELVRLRDALPDDVLLIVDEAYSEFVAEAEYAPVFDLVERGNVAVLRTFSKIYGLAGQRIAWGYFPPEVVDLLQRIQIPGNIPGSALAMALAALRDQAYVQEMRTWTAKLRDGFSVALRELGLDACPSHTNFVLVRFADVAEAESARNALYQEGIVVRTMGGYGLPHCLRISLGTEPQMEFVTETLKRWVEQTRKQEER